ncbi:MAG TPA: DNA-formamidopyrimidine glycosylase family protein [Candidatus Binatus sp.]|uniref:Fpg/Nei family DNA glycosylase n=1 Tax=Candidatus Binatus sp. TaxID=2811406 RepID=UPI002B46E100|nr:DNA-formamidopyrimidine glycosylase family protein [Candidatus Binatus sp.]HKN12794.1 DNA-formamidopyrimidine glycosylase family protein [Candidatus Binatus sp.]
MPELPDVSVYVEAIRTRVAGRELIRALVKSPFLLRSTTPPLSATSGKMVGEVRRLGKQIAIGVEGGLWLVLHLMIAGRLHWKTSAPKLGGRNILVAFEFDNGWLWLTEAGTKRRAALRVVEGEAGLASLNAGGIEPLDASLDAFSAALRSSNHTLKRSLTDPHIFSGIGNAYSDEILHRAQLSPIAMTQKLSAEEIEQLYDATRATLTEWTERLRVEAAGEFPEKVTAFRPEMAVHGRYGLPCPRCGAKVQRIRYASNETNYCAACQTGGRLLADRALSRLLHEDWPRTLEELEALKRR